MKACFLARPAPLIVGFAVTNRCNARCRYCDTWSLEGEEMPTGECLELLDEMASCGTLRIQFTGGEPLLRDDIGILLERCRSLGMFSTLSSNGWFVRERIGDLKAIGRLNISLDGREEANDILRGRGAFEKAMEGVEAARVHGIPFKFVTVLTKHTLGDIELMLDLAVTNSTNVFFQPALEIVLRGRTSNPAAPEREVYRKVIEQLLAAKRSGAPVANSAAGLRHLWHWPGPRTLRCVGGLIFCRIWPDGELDSCPRRPNIRTGGLNVRSSGFRRAFERLKVLPCSFCWSAPIVEAGCAFSFRPSSVINVLKDRFA